jgi:TrmH family RNA methyltransferase
MITSHHNDTLKDIRRLLRGRDGTRFVAEGEDLVDAAAEAGWAPEVRLRAGVDVTEEALAKVSALGSGTRELAVYEQRWAPAPLGPVCVYLHGVADPGNVGTILRGALAFGAGSVVLGPGCADPFGPKAVRASMGAIFAVPVVRAGAGDCPRPRVALVARAGEALAGPRTGTLVVGAERSGLPQDVVDQCEEVGHIPIASESLNAAMAATVGLYEWTRKVAR